MVWSDISDLTCPDLTSPQAAGLHGLGYGDDPLRLETGEDGGLTLQLAGRPVAAVTADHSTPALLELPHQPQQQPAETVTPGSRRSPAAKQIRVGAYWQ